MPDHPAPASMIGIHDVGKSFRSADGAVFALENVSLDIAQCDFVSIIGPSGCGKSTLMMCIAGLMEPTSGTITIAGNIVTGPVTDVGIVFQDSLMLDWRDVLGNVLFQIEMRGLASTSYRERALKLIEQVGLKGFERRYPWELSGGMRQRVALCRALIHDPPLLLMDEPFGALDTLTRDQMNVDLMRLCRGGNKTVVFITHSITEAIYLSDRVIVMSKRPGRVVEDIRVPLGDERRLSIRRSQEFIEQESHIYEIFHKLGVLSE